MSTGYSFSIDKATDLVSGWVSLKEGASLPSETPDERYVAGDAAKLDEFQALRDQAVSEGRLPQVMEVGGVFSLPPDLRPYIRIETDKTQVILDGVSSITLTISRLTNDGEIDTSFNGDIKLDLLGGRHLVTYANGIATKTIIPRASGLIEIRSNPLFRVETPRTWEVLEAG